MHIDAFIYDFQLRQAQQFLSGRNMIFYPGYPVQKLFERMIQIFPTPPKFSCCYLAEGIESLPLYRIWHCVIAAAPNHRSTVKFSSNDQPVVMNRLGSAVVDDVCLSRTLVMLQFFLHGRTRSLSYYGVIHLVRTHKRGRRSQAKAYTMRTKGKGGFQMEVRTQKRPVFARVL